MVAVSVSSTLFDFELSLSFLLEKQNKHLAKLYKYKNCWKKKKKLEQESSSGGGGEDAKPLNDCTLVTFSNKTPVPENGGHSSSSCCD